MDRKRVELLIQKNIQIGKRKVQKIKALAEEYGDLQEGAILPIFPAVLFPGRPDGRSSFYRFLHRHHLDEMGRAHWLNVVPEIVHQPEKLLSSIGAQQRLPLPLPHPEGQGRTGSVGQETRLQWPPGAILCEMCRGMGHPGSIALDFRAARFPSLSHKMAGHLIKVLSL